MLVLILEDYRSTEEAIQEAKEEFGEGGWPEGDHTLRARRTGMRPSTGDLDEARGSQRLKHNVDEVMRGVTIE